MIMEEQFYLGDISINSSWISLDDPDHLDSPERHRQFHALTGRWSVYFDHMGLEGDLSQLWLVHEGFEDVAWDAYGDADELPFGAYEDELPNSFGNIVEVWSSGFSSMGIFDLSDGCVLAECGLVCAFDGERFLFERLEDGEGSTVALLCEF